jgi:hypothetical protein
VRWRGGRGTTHKMPSPRLSGYGLLVEWSSDDLGCDAAMGKGAFGFPARHQEGTEYA